MTTNVIDPQLVAYFQKSDAGDADALEHLEGIAKSGNPDAEYLMGRLHDTSGQGKRAAQNLPLAKDWYERSAAHGHPLAQFFLANMYESGEGTEVNERQARRWYGAAALQGVDEAQMHLARMLQTGRGGSQSYGEAAHWYDAAARQGNELAATNLGLMHVRREIENASDEKALELFMYSASKLDGLAHLMLGEIYLNGRVVGQDVARAAVHYSVAALVLPDGKNKAEAVSMKASILDQNPKHRSRVEDLALSYIRKHNGSLPQ